MFTVEERNRARDRIVAMARADARVAAGAIMGSLAHGPGDRWSDLDLSFGLASGVAPDDVLTEWTRTIERELGGAHLFDLPVLATTYRVFLLPGCLQLDVSLTPMSDFGPRGPRFRLLFGEAVARPPVASPSARTLFGLGAHHAVRCRFCVERGRLWQALYWLEELRRTAMERACIRRGLEGRWGRGYDDLPPDVLEALHDTVAASLDAAEVRRALGSALDALLRESDDVRDVASKIESDLRRLTSPAI